MTERRGAFGDRPRRTVPTPDGGETPVVPRNYPDWSDPVLPTGPTPTTPGGSKTIKSGAGLHAQTLVAPGHRVPILFGRCLISPDLAKAKAETASGVTRGRFDVVISEGPIDAIESWYGATSFYSSTTSLGSLSPTSGLPSWSIGLACASILTNAWQPWLPQCIARGRKLYDPRLGAWGAGEYPNASYCAYSTNPALAMADLKCFPQYGQTSQANIDWTSVTNAANWCDALVSGSKRYEINLYLQEARTAEDWETTIGLHAGLRWRESGGKLYLDYSAPVAAAAPAITDDHVVEGTEPRVVYGGGAGLADRPNRFRAEWIDPASQWAIRTVEIRLPEVDAGAAIRDGEVYRLHGFQTEAMALRALWRIASEIASELELECELTAERIDLEEGMRVPVTLSSLGLSAVDFIVTRVSYDADRVCLTLRKYDSAAWTAPGSTSGALPTGGFWDTPPDLVSATRIDLESEVVSIVPTQKDTDWYLGFQWTLPSFDWPQDVVFRVWPAGAAPTWDTAGYTEFTFDAKGDPAFGTVSPWKASCRPIVFGTEVLTYDTLGTQIASTYVVPGYNAILRLRSIAGVMSAGVALSHAGGSYPTSTPATVEPVLMDAGFVATGGQIAVWDEAAGGVTFPAALAVVGPGASATIGGRMLIGVTVTLAADLAAAATTISVNRNTLASGDRIMLEGAPGGVSQTEFMAVTSGPSGAGPYTYSVTRNLDGSGANDWKKGDAIFNTGQTGTGFLDLYSARGLKAATEVGPAIVGNIRNSATWNDWSPRWAIGNLNGLYGYSANTYGAAFGVPTGPWLKIDATNGIRIGHNATTKVQVDASGNATYSGAITAASGTIGGWTIGASSLSSGAINLVASATPASNTIYIGYGTWGDANTPFYVGGDGKFALGDKLVFDGTDATLTIGDIVIDPSLGISMPAAGVGQSSSYGFLSGTTWIGGLYGVDSTYDAIGISCYSGSGSAIECRSTGQIVVVGWFNCDRYSTDSTDPGSGYYNATTGFKVGDVRVVSSRQPHITDATNATDVITRVNAILSLLETHGLMSSV